MTNSKYHARKTTVYGIEFDSMAEARYYLLLRDRQKRGEIRNLQRQVHYQLIPAAKVPKEKAGKQTTLRSCGYIVDFEYDDLVEKRHRWIDVKGMVTKEYSIKKKLMWYIHGIFVEEVKA